MPSFSAGGKKEQEKSFVQFKKKEKRKRMARCYACLRLSSEKGEEAAQRGEGNGKPITSLLSKLVEKGRGGEKEREGQNRKKKKATTV